MPDELKSQIVSCAQLSGRSLHSEILFRLSESLQNNRTESDKLGEEMRGAEDRLRISQVREHAHHLAMCVEVLLQMLRGPDPKAAMKAFSDLLEIAESAALEAKKYEWDLNPRKRLREYEKSIEKAEELLRVWAPRMLPWTGEGVPEDMQEKPTSKRIPRTRKK